MGRSSTSGVPQMVDVGLLKERRFSLMSDATDSLPPGSAPRKLNIQAASPDTAMRRASKRSRRTVNNARSSSQPNTPRRTRSTAPLLVEESLPGSQVTITPQASPNKSSLPSSPFCSILPITDLNVDFKSFTPVTRSRLSADPTPIATRESEPQTPLTKESQGTHQTLAQRLALSYYPSVLVGRDTEQQKLRNLLQTWGRTKSAGFIYVCGMPGSGKTLTTTTVVRKLPAKSIIVNCATLEDPTRIFDVILEELGVKCTFQTRRHARQALSAKVCELRRQVVVVLDELDFLTSRDQNTLYSLFELPKQNGSRLSMIGIANSLDLPQRLLPWLRSTDSMPEVIAFAPYDAPALSNILTQRVQSADLSKPDGTSLDPMAIRLCALKVASGSGDARVALDTCRMAVQTVSSGEAPSCLPVISSVLQTKGGIASGLKAIANLPVHQQLVLCAAYRRFKKKVSKKDATLREMYQSFVLICAQVHVDKLTFSQFADICRGSLVHHDLIAIKDAKNNRSCTLRLKVSEDDIREALSENRLFTALLP